MLELECKSNLWYGEALQGNRLTRRFDLIGVDR